MRAVWSRAAFLCHERSLPPLPYDSLSHFTLDELLSLSDSAFHRCCPRHSSEAWTALLDACLEASSPLCCDALITSEREEAHRKRGLLSFGPFCGDLDLLVGGGLDDELIEVVSPSSCGKTQLSLQTAGWTAFRGHEVFFIDASSSFNADRLSEMAKFWMSRESAIQQKKSSPLPLTRMSVMSVKGMLQRIERVEVDNVFELLAVIERVNEALTRQMYSRHAQQLRLIVVDSIAAVLSSIVGGSQRSYALMEILANLLKSLAHTHHIAVLITNHTVANRIGAREQIRPALGAEWSRVADTRLIFREAPIKRDCAPVSNCTETAEGLPEPCERKPMEHKLLVARLDKSCRTVSGGEIALVLRQRGICSTDRPVS